MTDAPAAHILTGSWALVAAFIDVPGGERFDYLGATPRGRLILDPSGYMAALLTAGERSGDDAAPSMLAYTGRFTADGASFVTQVDAASLPAWEGTAQRRDFVVDGDRLTIRTPPGPHPAYPGVEVSATLEWRREG